jgi:hypothetical protein
VFPLGRSTKKPCGIPSMSDLFGPSSEVAGILKQESIIEALWQ